MAQPISQSDFRIVKRNRFWWRFYNIPLWVLVVYAVIANGVTAFTAYNGFVAISERDGKITQAEQNAALGGTAATVAGMQLLFIPIGVVGYLLMLVIGYAYRSEATDSLKVKLLLALREINPTAVQEDELITDVIIEIDATERAQLKSLLSEICIESVTDNKAVHSAFQRLQQSLSNE